MNATLLTIFGICFIFLMTCLGASIIFFLKKDLSDKSHALLVSFSNGIMLASSIWSLLIPAIDSSSLDYGKWSVVPVSIGFLLGCLFMFLIDFLSSGKKQKSPYKRTGLSKHHKVLLAISLHNIPEGLSVGIAFGSALATGNSALLMIAVSLAVGIGLQNIPEGMAVALPMYESTKSKGKAFGYGMISGIIEPIFAVFGLILSSFFSSLLPWFLAFAGGTMIFTLAGEMGYVGQDDNLKNRMTWTFIAGFLIMMILDVVFA